MSSISISALGWKFVNPFVGSKTKTHPYTTRPYLRQLFSKGRWQCNLPNSNQLALCVIEETLRKSGGYAELERSDNIGGLLRSDAPGQIDYFLAKAKEWLHRNPGF